MVGKQFRVSEIKIFSDYEYNLQNQKYFSSQNEKSEYINNLAAIYDKNDHSYIRDGSIQINMNYETALKAKYIKYKNIYEQCVYFAQVTHVEYVSSARPKSGEVREDVTKIYFAIDWINTLDLNVGRNLHDRTVNSVIERQHVRKIEEAAGLYSLVDTGTDITVNHESLLFKKYHVLLQSTASLNGDYGDADKPIISAAEGQVYDNLPSAQTAYVMELKHFGDFLNSMKKYPWITQNFTNITMLPTEMIDTNNLEKLDAHKDVYKLESNGHSINPTFEEISFDFKELRARFNLNEDGSEDELLRYPHSYLEIVDYSGGYFIIDPAFLPKQGLKVTSLTTLGSLNQLDVYIEDYKNKTHDGSATQGEFLGTSLTLTNFPILPVQIDNYQLSLATTAYSRKVQTEEIYFKGFMGLFSSLGQVGNGLSLMKTDQSAALDSVLGSYKTQFNTVTDFYFDTQKQMAAYEDKRITPPTLTSQSTNYGNLIANQEFGIHVRFKQNQEIALNRVKADLCFFGFPVKRIGRIETPNNMTIVDFVKTSSINFDNRYIPKLAVPFLSELFSMGVHFWHESMTADINDNIRKNL